jgi:hypothetical protein
MRGSDGWSLWWKAQLTSQLLVGLRSIRASGRAGPEDDIAEIVIRGSREVRETAKIAFSQLQNCQQDLPVVLTRWAALKAAQQDRTRVLLAAWVISSDLGADLGGPFHSTRLPDRSAVFGEFGPPFIRTT